MERKRGHILLNWTVFTYHTNNSCKIYNWLIKRHVSALFDQHQAYRKMVLIKVHSFAIAIQGSMDVDEERRTSCPNFWKGKYWEEYMVLNMKTGEWRSRTNRDLEEMSKGENIVKRMKGQRMSWLGHLEWMEEDRMPKKITQELEGTRRRGRPRERWKEKVERDLQVLGVRRWRELVADRKKWKDIVGQPKAHIGL